MTADASSVILSAVPRTSTYHLTDRLLGGKLGDLLLDSKNRGESVEDIAFVLRSEHEIRVSTATVYRWLVIAESERSEASA